MNRTSTTKRPAPPAAPAMMGTLDDDPVELSLDLIAHVVPEY